nr:hypothetical protein [uncultured Cetobacterium sp.]
MATKIKFLINLFSILDIIKGTVIKTPNLKYSKNLKIIANL